MTGDALYIIGTVLQLVAYARFKVSIDVVCWAGVAYWIALLAAYKLGSLR